MHHIFYAPEIYNSRTKADPSMDVWSLGAILYMLVVGEVLQKASISKFCNKVESVYDYTEPQWSFVDTKLKHFI